MTEATVSVARNQTGAVSEGWQPHIVALVCNWCSYAGADLAGVSRIQYPTNIRIIRVMCSGRVDPALPLGFLAEGADGVMITGCHIGDCHYNTGNHRTARRMPVLKKLLEFTGIEPERFLAKWVAASEGGLFVETVQEFTEALRGLPPLSSRFNAPANPEAS